MRKSIRQLGQGMNFSIYTLSIYYYDIYLQYTILIL